MCAWRVAEKKKQRDGMGEEDGRRTVRVQWSCDKDKSDALVRMIIRQFLNMSL